jgi:WD40 repeat protein
MDSFNLWHSYKAHNLSVSCLTTINDRNLFASGSEDFQIKIWDSNFKNIQTLFAHSGSIIALIFLNEINSANISLLPVATL